MLHAAPLFPFSHHDIKLIIVVALLLRKNTSNHNVFNYYEKSLLMNIAMILMQNKTLRWSTTVLQEAFIRYMRVQGLDSRIPDETLSIE